MATVLMSVEEYLRTGGKFEPDAEYVDGEIEVRPMGEDDHSAWQTAIAHYFSLNADRWGIRVRAELRLQITPTRFRIPDVSILDRSLPKERIATIPPIAVFEVLSPEDTVKRVRTRLHDYESMGIPTVFLLDPETGVFERYTAGELRVVKAMEMKDRGIVFAFSEIAKLVT